MSITGRGIGGRRALGRTTAAIPELQSTPSLKPMSLSVQYNAGFDYYCNDPDRIFVQYSQYNDIYQWEGIGRYPRVGDIASFRNGGPQYTTRTMQHKMWAGPIVTISWTAGEVFGEVINIEWCGPIPESEIVTDTPVEDSTDGSTNEPVEDPVGDNAVQTYSGSVAFNFNFTERSDYWAHPLNVMESIYVVGTNVDTGLQHVLYEHLEEDVYPIHPYYGSYPMLFGESANSLIVHRYEDKEAHSLAPSDLGNLLTITFKLKQGLVFTYNDDEDRGWSDINNVTMHGELVRVNESDPVWGSEYGGTSSQYFTWKRIESGANQQTWAVTLDKYPWANGDWVYMLRDSFIGHVQVVGDTVYQAPSGLNIINATDNQLYDVGPAGGYGQMLSNYSFDAQMQFPLSLDAFNIPTEDYSDIYAAGINYYDIGRVDMELESPVTVMYVLYDEYGSAHTIYESDPISSTGFVQIGLEDLSQKISEEMAYNPYTITKAELYIYSHTEHYSLTN